MSQESNEELQPFDVIMVGDYQAGKSSIFGQLYCGSMNAYTKCSFFHMEIKRKDERLVKLRIWDTADQERFHGLAPSYYRKSSIVVLCFDLNNRKSFDNLQHWMEQVEENNSTTKYLLVGCKLDEENRKVSSQEASVLISKYSLRGGQYLETSSKTGTNCELLKTTLAEMIDLPELKTVEQLNDSQPTVINNYNFYCSIM